MRTMGIDLGIKKLAYSLWDDEVLVNTNAYVSDSITRPKQLEDLANYIALVDRYEHPSYIFIEDTLIGNNRKYSIQLSQTMGAVLAALANSSIFLVNVSTWKKEVVGSGNATKEDVQGYITSLDSAYSVICGRDQDQYDAAAIGYYGYLIHIRAMEVTRQISN